MKPLTPHQQAVLSAAEILIRDKGYAPTIDELTKKTGYLRCTVQGCLKALKRKGFLDWDKSKNRTLMLKGVQDSPEALETKKRIGALEQQVLVLTRDLGAVINTIQKQSKLSLPASH